MKIFMLFLLIFVPLLSGAQEGLLNKLLAPGPLIQGHADLESNACLKCHNVGKGIDNAKCLECHKDIKMAVAAKKGYHGLTIQTCISCHTDHKGKAHDTVKVDEKTFDHKKTGLVLAGKHALLSCSKCHTNKRTGKFLRPTDTRYFKTQASCVACHKKDDVHFYQGEFAKKDCNACHSLNSWKKEIVFDHQQISQYQLEGKHREISCAKCHVPSKDKPIYTWPQLKTQKCLSCHTDHHKNNLSAKFRTGDCTTCHAQDTWKLPQFNHTSTGYPLKGKHAVAKCTDCHKANLGLTKDFNWTGLKQNCLTCHKDTHEFGDHKSQRLSHPNKCETCHQETSWKEVKDFQHNRDTRFFLTGKHLPLQCTKCHVRKDTSVPERKYHWQGLENKTCESCHKNPHTTAFSKQMLNRKCTDCHSAEGWKIAPTKMNKNFNHKETRFSLDGSHSALTCAACHIKSGQQVFRFPTAEKNFCTDCHQSPHTEQFHENIQQKSCLECHETTKFDKLKVWNHDQVHFKLAGAHTKVKCASCHVSTKEFLAIKEKKVKHQFMFPGVNNSTCAKCHDDFHRGTLGQDCQKCHSEKESWKRTLFNHDQMSRFPLKGKHTPLQCSKCHVPGEKTTRLKNETRKLIVYRELTTDCSSCHKKNDVHKGNFGANCQDCHNENGWKQHQDFHKDFRLSGVHYTLTCNECHFNERRLGGMSDNCFLCHQKDDVHYGSIPNCGACHRQSFWDQTTFRHSMTNFPLRGSHRTLECVNCHSSGIYEGTPTQCIDCHLQDALGVSTPNHSMSGFQRCTDCHNQFTFGKLR